MGFEESMIEDSFHDEEDYLEHLMDEADREWECQQYEQSSYQEEYEDDEFYDEDDEEYYEGLLKQYQQWAKENPLKHKVFLAWAYFDTEKDSDSRDDNFLLDRFENWQREEDWQTERMKDYYGDDFYQQILSYFKWKIENPIEEILRQPQIEYFYPTDTFPYVQEIPPRDLLIEEVNEFEEWIELKKKYEQWLSTSSEVNRKEYLDEIIESEFKGDISVGHVKDCMLKQLEAEKTLDFTKEKVMKWYDEDGERGRDLFFMIKCVQNFYEE